MNPRNIHHVKKEKIQAHGGIGLINFARVYGTPEAPLPDNTAINFIDVAVLPPNTSVGLHLHEDSTEIYLILEGEGKYRQNDTTFPVQPGDVLINHLGKHSLLNDGNKPLKIFVIETALNAGDEL